MNEKCHDCGVEVGQAHLGGCDVARCLWSGIQRLQYDSELAAKCCKVMREAGRDDLAEDLAHYLDLADPDHDCGEDIWDGTWPGEADCQRLDLWCFWGPDYNQRGWVRCDKDHPGAREDLNRLLVECEWNRQAQRWEKRS